MTTREAFEAWAASVTPVPVVRRIEDNVIAWYAWQAATLAERERWFALLDNPPKHRFWMAGELDCPKELRAANGELHTLRCRVCGVTSPRNDICADAIRKGTP
jgi:hypothetical protein